MNFRAEYHNRETKSDVYGKRANVNLYLKRTFAVYRCINVTLSLIIQNR